jgi:hypothetical protein
MGQGYLLLFFNPFFQSLTERITINNSSNALLPLKLRHPSNPNLYLRRSGPLATQKKIVHKYSSSSFNGIQDLANFQSSIILQNENNCHPPQRLARSDTEETHCSCTPSSYRISSYSTTRLFRIIRKKQAKQTNKQARRTTNENCKNPAQWGTKKTRKSPEYICASAVRRTFSL